MGALVTLAQAWWAPFRTMHAQHTHSRVLDRNEFSPYPPILPMENHIEHVPDFTQGQWTA